MKSLNNLFVKWSVISPGMWENDDGPKDWWAVCNDVGIVAYFGTESDALCFRLDKINTELNRK